MDTELVIGGILILSAIIIAVLFVKIVRLDKQTQHIQSQLQAWELLINDLQFNHAQLEKEHQQIDGKLASYATENEQVSRQLEHRIKNLQQELTEQKNYLLN